MPLFQADGNGGARGIAGGVPGMSSLHFKDTKRMLRSSCGYITTPGFIFVRTIFDQKGNCSPFLKLTPTPRQMPRDVTNISED